MNNGRMRHGRENSRNHPNLPLSQADGALQRHRAFNAATSQHLQVPQRHPVGLVCCDGALRLNRIQHRQPAGHIAGFGQGQGLADERAGARPVLRQCCTNAAYTRAIAATATKTGPSTPQVS